MFSEKSGYAKRRLAGQWSGKQSYLKYQCSVDVNLHLCYIGT